MDKTESESRNDKMPTNTRGFLLIVITLTLITCFSISAYAQRTEVNAKTNSSTGGVGKDTGIDVRSGQRLTIRSNPSHKWRSAHGLCLLL